MTGFFFLWLFLFFFALELGINVWLDGLNARKVREHRDPPDFFREKMPPETYAKSRKYTLEQLKFNKWDVLAGALITLMVLFSGLLPFLNNIVSGWAQSPVWRGVLFLGTLGFLLYLLKLPFTLYHTFVLEAKYGFNTMTLPLFLQDSLKSLLLSAVLGLPLLAGVLWLLEITGPSWWWWAFLLIAGIQILLLLAYPTLIAPLFNKFKQLEDGETRRELMSLAEQARFGTSGIYVMDGSRRSKHSNAYFTGFGKWRRIVLFDTLLAQLNTDELKSVLSHEIGHYKKGHVYRRMLSGFVFLGAALFLLSWVIQWKPLYQAFGLDADPSQIKYIGLFLFSVTFSTFTFLLGPLLNFLSRKHEFEADAFAVKQMGEPRNMASALLKLAEKNLSNLTPHPWYSAFHYSHPSLYERISALEKGGVEWIRRAL